MKIFLKRKNGGRNSKSNYKRKYIGSISRNRGSYNRIHRIASRKDNGQNERDFITKINRPSRRDPRTGINGNMVEQSDSQNRNDHKNGDRINQVIHMTLSTEILTKIFLLVSTIDQKSLNLVNKSFHEIITNILFTYPNLRWYANFEANDIYKLPIHIIKLSSILNDFDPEKCVYLHTIIIDSTFHSIAPNLMKNYPNISFLISINVLYANNDYHYSNFCLNNLKIFTTSDSFVSLKRLLDLKKFCFHHVCLSHIEGEEFTVKELFTTLNQLKINRLIFDTNLCNMISISPHFFSIMERLSITHLSSSLFLKDLFPIDLLHKIPLLEKVYIEKGTKFLFNDVKNLQYAYIYQRYPRHACEACGLKDIYSNSIENLLKIENEIATAQEKFILCFKPTPKKWLLKFEYDFIHSKCVKKVY